jgi:hypothetical protein
LRSTARAPAKGNGFSELEFALLVEAGLIGKDTLLAITTVHHCRCWPRRCQRFRTTSAWI